jgi:hypothetical protein
MEQIGGSSQRMEEDQAVVVGERVRPSRGIGEDLQVVSGSTAVGRRWWCPSAIVGIRGVVIEGGRLSEEREREREVMGKEEPVIGVQSTMEE